MLLTKLRATTPYMSTSAHNITLTLQRRITAACICCLLAVGTATAAPIDDAGEAYNKSVYVQAIKLFRPLAAQGNADAQAMLGMMYLKGEGTTRNYPEAVKWLLLSAAQGNASAQNNLGAMHFNGDGVVRNYQEAMRLFRLSAMQGDKYGQTSLAAMYLNGYGVAKDVKEAVKWYRLAAAQGDVNAEKALKRLNQ